MRETVVILAAHAFEARSAASVGRSVTRESWGRWMLYRGEMWDMPLAVIRCGPGKVAAAAAAQAAIQYLNPTVLISFGVAGCPDTSVPTGTLAVATTVVDVALTELQTLPMKIPDNFEPQDALTDCFLEIPGPQACRLLCWEGYVVSPIRRPPPQLMTDGLVLVDWESSAVAQVAEMWQVPWAACKVVSDHGETERLRLLALAAKRPLKWGAEVIRRACDAYAQGRITKQHMQEPEEVEA